MEGREGRFGQREQYLQESACSGGRDDGWWGVGLAAAEGAEKGVGSSSFKALLTRLRVLHFVL